MPSLPTIGRWLYALPCVVFGSIHLLDPSRMVPMVPIPGGVFWVYLTGVALIAATVAILTGIRAVPALRLLGLMLLIFALAVHLPGAVHAPSQAAMDAAMSNLLKDTMLAGAGWFMSGHVPSVEDGHGPESLSSS